MEQLKHVYSPDLVRLFSFHLQRHIGDFDREKFEIPILKNIESLELSQRSQLIADQLHLTLPKDYKKRAKILIAILHPNFEAKQSDEQGIGGWGSLPLTLVVAQHGFEDFENSLNLLKKMTGYFSSEFAIRYFLLEDEKRTLKTIIPWIKDKNHHVRRLVSEGTRPRLPWAMQLPSFINDPSPILPILENLRDDESEYVRRSVANHLNDIAKDHPDLVANLAIKWMKGANRNQEKLVRHAIRTLVKDGNVLALKAIGISEPEVKIKQINIANKQVIYGEALEFDFEIISKSDKSQDIIIDYLVHFKKANGQLKPKIFKLSKFTLKANEKKTIQRKHSIRPITTRKYYAGNHALSLRVNGKDSNYCEFELLME